MCRARCTKRLTNSYIGPEIDSWQPTSMQHGSRVVSDSEQRKHHNLSTYRVHVLPNTAPDGFKITFQKVLCAALAGDQDGGKS